MPKFRSRLFRFFVLLGAATLTLAIFGALAAGGMYWYFARGLPYPKAGIQVQLKEPLRVYTADHKLIGVFGREKREPIRYKNIPPDVVHAFVAAEDDRFFEHPGVDYQGILRAAVHLVETGRKTQGGSTITMQLARDLYLTDKRTYTRKIKEVILALRLEDKFTKQQIFQLYVNKIYLGQGAYGVVAAARTYYQKPLNQLDLAQVAMIAGLPKAPSTFNPISNPSGAKQRRNYVLDRMHALGKISDTAYQKAHRAPVTADRGGATSSGNRFSAPYVAEMVRKKMVDRYGKKAYTAGYKVTTTITSKRQGYARAALRDDLLAYAGRHRWHGSGHSVSADVATNKTKRGQALAKLRTYAGLIPAIVVATQGSTLRAATAKHGIVDIDAAHNPWLRAKHDASDMVAVGDIVRLVHATDQSSDKDNPSSPWSLAEIPNVQGALVSLDPHNGAIQALMGGFDFNLSKFNRATQARRQPGSSFKPFLYSAALAHGFTTATIVNDAPIVYNDPSLDKSWRPQNYSGKIFGPTRLRIGLVHSRNLVSIRVLRRIGINTGVKWATRFGLPEKQLPHNLSLALGSASFSPLQMARGYSVFANDGFLIKPYLIQTITRARHKTVYQASPKLACADPVDCPSLANGANSNPSTQLAPRAIPADNAFLVGDMMRSVITHGTGRQALTLHRTDLSGKTGTTNKQIDAWFGGFNANLVTVSWVGFDKLRPLGKHETGAHAALPMWISYMGKALHGQPTAIPKRPEDIVSVKIDPKTGDRSLNGAGIDEIFRKDNVPTKAAARRSGEHSASEEVQSLF